MFLPQGQQPAEQFWQSQDDATKAVNAMYANLRGWTFVAFAPMAVESLASDDAVTGSDPTDGSVAFMSQFDNFTVTSTNSELPDFWNGMYQEINYCNQVLDNIPNIQYGCYIKGALFIGSQIYPRLFLFQVSACVWRCSIKIACPKRCYRIQYSPLTKQVWAAIEQDLNDAAALPASYNGADVGRATSGAALALHAKVAIISEEME